MFGPSGFFQNIGDIDSPMNMTDLEVIYVGSMSSIGSARTAVFSYIRH